ncbi:mucin-2-like [Cydia splendana]|uniref:mucin-2-like n=1 Tax=Cydia splendana TaxID=1100963 RepID=UPI00213469BF
MVTPQRERDVIAEILEIYRDLPCLWDLSSHLYSDKIVKKNAWEILVTKYKEIEPEANEATVKRKIENLKSSYQREVRKVKESKNRTGSGASEVYKPNLWYFDLMTFLDKKDEVKRAGVDSLLSEDEDGRIETSAKRKKQKPFNAIEIQQQKLLNTAENLLKENKKETNPFGIYVGDTLEQISSDQREIAEKLISDVLFLARRNNLTTDSKIEANPRHAYHTHAPQYNSSPYFIQSPFSAEVSQSPHSSSDVSFNPSPQPQMHQRKFVYAPQIIQRAFSPVVCSPAHTHTQPPPSLPSFHPTLVTYSPHHIQSPPTPTRTQTPNPSPSFHLSQNTPVTYAPHHIQSPPTPTRTQTPNPSPSFHFSQNTPVTYAPHHIQSPPTPNRSPSCTLVRVQSPPAPTQMQNPNPASLSPITYSPIHIQVSHPTYTEPPTIHVPESQDHSSLTASSMDNEGVNIIDNTVVYSGPANELLKELLVFKK